MSWTKGIKINILKSAMKGFALVALAKEGRKERVIMKTYSKEGIGTYTVTLELGPSGEIEDIGCYRLKVSGSLLEEMIDSKKLPEAIEELLKEDVMQIKE